LELDLFQTNTQETPVPAYCLVENVPIQELAQADQWRDLHGKLMENYRRANWAFCEQALEHLIGKWNGEVDSFYQDLRQRVENLRDQGRSQSDWDPILKI
jgi:hypothetical protein